MKLAREPASTRPKPRASLENAPGILTVRLSTLSLVERNRVVVKDKLSPPKRPALALWFSRTRVQYSPDSWANEHPSASPNLLYLLV